MLNCNLQTFTFTVVQLKPRLWLFAWYIWLEKNRNTKQKSVNVVLSKSRKHAPKTSAHNACEYITHSGVRAAKPPRILPHAARLRSAASYRPGYRSGAFYWLYFRTASTPIQCKRSKFSR